MKPGPKRSIAVDPDTGCHVAQRNLNHSGYAVYKHNGKRHSAARVVWMEQRGPIPDDMQVDHLCRNRACVNVEHMELVTCVENIRRSPRCKLDMAQARMIRAACDVSHRELARRFGVTEGLIRAVRKSDIWREDESLLRAQREQGA